MQGTGTKTNPGAAPLVRATVRVQRRGEEREVICMRRESFTDGGVGGGGAEAYACEGVKQECHATDTEHVHGLLTKYMDSVLLLWSFCCKDTMIPGFPRETLGTPWRAILSCPPGVMQ